jgi:hypothetical protein
MKTEEAERLLREAKHDLGCNADEPGGDCCPGCGYVTAVATIQNMAADSRRVAIKLAEALGDLVPLALAAMHEANNDGAEYDADGELADARQALADWDALVERPAERWEPCPGRHRVKGGSWEGYHNVERLVE